MKTPLVSIIIPIYNSEAFLDKCIQSAINQSYKNIEIILVNDGSIDSSSDICKNYSATDNRIKIINKKNGGLVSARKAGVTESSGEYVLYIDADDWIELNLLENYIEQLVNHDADIIISSHIVNLEGREDVLMNSIPAGVYRKPELESLVYPKMLNTGKFSQFGIFSYSWGKLYRKSILMPNQLNVDETVTIGEDALCLYPSILDSNTIVIIEKPYYHYRHRADSLTKTMRKIEISTMQKVYDELKSIFLQKQVLNVMLPQLQMYLLSLLIINTEGPDPAKILYPFDTEKLGENVVIYGGGTFGQHIYKKIIANKTKNLLAWIDEKHKHYSKLNLPVTGFDRIKSIDYESVLIALIDEDNSNKAFSKLVKHGVDGSKILQVPYYGKNETITTFLSQYGINL